MKRGAALYGRLPGQIDYTRLAHCTPTGTTLLTFPVLIASPATLIDQANLEILSTEVPSPRLAQDPFAPPRWASESSSQHESF